MGYPVLPPERSRETLEALRTGGGVPSDAVVSVETVNDAPGDLEALGRKLRELLPGRPLPDRSRGGFAFDVEAAKVIHQFLDRDHPALTDRGFWRYLAVVELHQVIDWRYGGREGRANNLRNFGIGGNLEECYPYRCWLHADIAYDIAYDESSADPYAWASVGDPDIWRSHLFRQNWARDRRVAKAFLKVICGETAGGKPIVPGCDPRKLAKELRRISATFTLAALDEQKLNQLIQELAARCR
ncbi:MAG: hypothetical protein KatS3mg015_3220 [Fimbriimonadales bacterium]|nr:MAG: hypothetical protein KatS3mg015_3220 [Fimbriimonadales bacterium]